MRLVLIIVTLLSLQQTGVTRIRLLLRNEIDAGVAGATLTLRTENGQTLQLTTDANGVAVSDVLVGKAVWLMGGRLADGTDLIADSYPADAGFRLMLIPGQVRDALLRLDGERLVLDPDMIFSPNDPHAPQPTPPQLVATIAPPSIPAAAIASVLSPIMPTGSMSATPPAAGTARWIVLALVLLGVLLIALALLIGIVRRRWT